MNRPRSIVQGPRSILPGFRLFLRQGHVQRSHWHAHDPTGSLPQHLLINRPFPGEGKGVPERPLALCHDDTG